MFWYYRYMGKQTSEERMPREGWAMRRLAMVLMAAVAVAPGAGLAPKQPSGGWVGQRVITQFGTVLKVGNRVVDREHLTRTARGVERRSFRIYQVERVSGARLWLVAENEDVSGWVPMAQVITLDRAIEYYTGKIRSHPENDMAYINRGHIWAKRGDYDQAIADYTEAIQIDRREDLGYQSRGNTWFLKGDFDKAVADFNEAIQIGPNDPCNYCFRGSTWEKKGLSTTRSPTTRRRSDSIPSTLMLTICAPGSGPPAPMPRTATARVPSRRPRVPASYRSGTMPTPSAPSPPPTPRPGTSTPRSSIRIRPWGGTGKG